MKYAIAKQIDTSQNTRQRLNTKYAIISIHKNKQLAKKNDSPNELPITEIIKISDDFKKGDEINISGEKWYSVLGPGGRRDGAGRPPLPKILKKTPVSIRLPEWLIQWMDDQPDTNRAILIEDALKEKHNISEPDDSRV